MQATSRDCSELAAELVGIEYRQGGADESGVDCWGIVRLIYKRLYGVDLPPLDALPTPVQRHGWVRVIQGQEMPGDVLHIRGKDGPHVGVVVKPGSMIHADEGVGVVIESYLGLRWINRIQAIYRLSRP